MSEKLDRRKKYTRMILKETLIELLYKKSISSITVKELCEQADINRSTFYTHYQDHYDLLNKIEDELANDLSSYLQRYNFSEQEESVKMTQKLVEYVQENQKIFNTLLNHNADPAFEKRMSDIARQFLMSNWEKVNHTNSAQSSYLSTFTISGAIHVIKEWLENDQKEPPSELAELIYRLSTGALYTQEK
ncbi:TetR/AcrR family transcriptional regulator [Halalkalibacillus halophilus]|uniref:TetR/AcrR family transcriptional regulator n=1 Tax=Halalkalibacillus halophilus TaxID=392827 RepID=UPI00040F3B75|nr:TetR-like C-terminal domain-containing protein [Halalkalibacillus halophilus]